MPPRRMRVFVSSTSRDLKLHRKVVREAILNHGWEPIMMEDFGSLFESTVPACTDFVRTSDMVVCVLAFRRGWVPTKEQHGDGERSVTAFEIDAAKERRIPIYYFLADDSWPGGLWEHEQPAALKAMKTFRNEVNQPSGFFPPGLSTTPHDEPEPSAVFRNLIRETLVRHRETIQFQHEAKTLPSTPERIRGLVPILKQFHPDWTTFEAAYRRSVPLDSDWEIVSSKVAKGTHGVAYASDLTRAVRQSDNSYPLFTFVQALLTVGTATDGPIDQLERWLTEAMNEASTHPSTVSKWRDQHEAAATPLPTWQLARVVVRIDSSRFAPTDLFVKAWLIDRGRTVCVFEDHPEQALRQRADIPAAFDQILNACLDRVEDPSQWRVELLLPRALLCDEADRWPVSVDMGLGESPLGYEHQVVVRPLVRYSPAAKAALAELRKRAEPLRLALEQPCAVSHVDPTTWIEAHAVRIPPTDAGGVELRNRLKNAANAVCAILEAAPPSNETNPRTDILNAVLAAGLPVAVWLREGCPADAGIPDVLAKSTLKGFPHWVHGQRKAAVDLAAPNHAGRHLTLVWDDPSEPLPETETTRWRPPT
jgi:hypothetical protein